MSPSLMQVIMYIVNKMIIRLKRILLIDTHKNVIRYEIEHELQYVNKYVNNATS